MHFKYLIMCLIYFIQTCVRLTYFLHGSYVLLRYFLHISYVCITNFLWASCVYLRYFLQTSHKHLTKFSWMCYILLMNFLQTSQKYLTNFLNNFHNPTDGTLLGLLPLHNFLFLAFVQRFEQGILKGEESLYCWPPIWLVWN